MRPTPAVDRGAQLVEALVVAVQHAALGRHPGRQGDVQLAAGGDVEVHALLVGEAGHRPAQERLGGVGDAVAERVDRLAAAGRAGGLVVDEQRRAELGGQVASDRSSARRADHDRRALDRRRSMSARRKIERIRACAYCR
jgi:hypothetical protein